MSEHEGKPKQPLATEVIANAPRRDTYSPEEQCSGNPHLQPGELQKAWHEKPLKPRHKPAKS
jgi:hypothetical protein